MAPMNCSSRVNSHFTGRPVFIVASTQRSSESISCLPPKPPPTRSVKTARRAGRRPNRWQSFCWAMNGRLRARADMQPAVLAAPGDRAVRLQMDVLHPRGRIGHLVDGVGRREAVGDAADLAVDVDIDVAPLRAALVVQHRGIRLPWPPPDRRRPAGSRSSTSSRRQAVSAAASVSATTAATRWPTKRTTLSSM